MSTPLECQPSESTSATVSGMLEAEQKPSIRSDAPVIIPTLEAAWAPSGLRRSSRTAPHPKHVQVHIAQNLHELGAWLPVQPVVAARERHGLDRLVHVVLFVGLVISTVLMLIEMGLDTVAWHTIPIAVPTIGDWFGRLLYPFNFLSVGLLVLIATPIFSVGAAICVLLHERDWRYVAITTLVLVILIASLLLGSS
jgi:uncharacterized membrane protein